MPADGIRTILSLTYHVPQVAAILASVLAVTFARPRADNVNVPFLSISIERPGQSSVQTDVSKQAVSIRQASIRTFSCTPSHLSEYVQTMQTVHRRANTWSTVRRTAPTSRTSLPSSLYRRSRGTPLSRRRSTFPTTQSIRRIS